MKRAKKKPPQKMTHPQKEGKHKPRDQIRDPKKSTSNIYVIDVVYNYCLIQVERLAKTK